MDIIALQHSFDVLQELTGGIPSIADHTFSLAQYVHHKMSDMKHGNGRPVCELYCDTGFDAISNQGPIVNFNVLRSNGDHVGYSQVRVDAIDFNISPKLSLRNYINYINYVNMNMNNE